MNILQPFFCLSSLMYIKHIYTVPLPNTHNLQISLMDKVLHVSFKKGNKIESIYVVFSHNYKKYFLPI
jgi:hypothetical protein